MKAVAILSGGMDSATALAMAKEKDIEITDVVWFDYGQRHRVERLAMEKIAAHYGHMMVRVIDIPDVFGSNQLTNYNLEPRKNTPMREITKGVAPTFVPGRNMVMLALAASYADGIGCSGVVGGWHWDDSSGYPDCRHSFLLSMQGSINEALGVQDFFIEMPLISLSKQQIVENAIRLGVPLEKTWSCYDPSSKRGPIEEFYYPVDIVACGQCDTCQLRIKGFKDAGWIDPIPYAIPIDWTGCDPIFRRPL